MRARTRVIILTLIGTCLIVPFVICYLIAGTMPILGWIGLAAAVWLFYSNAYDHYIATKTEGENDE